MQLTGSRQDVLVLKASLRGGGEMRRLLAGSCTTRALLKLIGIAGLIVAAMLPAGCANQSYMGISLAPGQAEASLQQLARSARAGDKKALFDLGHRFETGAGLPKDRSRAMKLYDVAGHPTGGYSLLSIPAAAGSSTVPVYLGPYRAPLPEAVSRLKALKSGADALDQDGGNQSNVIERRHEKIVHYNVNGYLKSVVDVPNSALCDGTAYQECRIVEVLISNCSGPSECPKAMYAQDLKDDNGHSIISDATELSLFDAGQRIRFEYKYLEKYSKKFAFIMSFEGE